MKLLTWNVAGASVSRQAPELFEPLDKLPLVKHEIVDRWAPDIFTLQECVTAEALPGFAEEYNLVGAEYVEVQRAYVHLYAKKALDIVQQEKLKQWPGVLAALSVGDEELVLAAVRQDSRAKAQDRHRVWGSPCKAPHDLLI